MKYCSEINAPDLAFPLNQAWTCVWVICHKVELLSNSDKNSFLRSMQERSNICSWKRPAEGSRKLQSNSAEVALKTPSGSGLC